MVPTKTGGLLSHSHLQFSKRQRQPLFCLSPYRAIQVNLSSELSDSEWTCPPISLPLLWADAISFSALPPPPAGVSQLLSTSLLPFIPFQKTLDPSQSFYASGEQASLSLSLSFNSLASSDASPSILSSRILRLSFKNLCVKAHWTFITHKGSLC